MDSIVFVLLAAGLSLALAEDAGIESHNRVKRTFLLKKKLCYTLGLCGGEHSGHGNGYGGYQSYQGGYPYPPINIGISQSQSSSNAGGGGFGTGYYPNNYQYNGGYHGGYPYQVAYGGYGPHGGIRQRPGYNNGYGSNNNQFNGNYYGGRDEYPYGAYGRSDNLNDGGDDKPVYESNEDEPYNYKYGREDNYDGDRSF